MWRHWINVQAGKAYLVGQLATAWAVRGSSPGKAKHTVVVNTDPGAHSASHMMGNVSLSRL
jgi:hypothetical protein